MSSGSRLGQARSGGFPPRNKPATGFTSQIRFPKIPNLKAFPRFLVGSTTAHAGSAASSFPNPIAAELEGVGLHPTAKALASPCRAAAPDPGMVGVSYVVDAVILLFYAYAGTIPVMIAPAHAGCGLALVAVNTFSPRSVSTNASRTIICRAAVGAVHGGCAPASPTPRRKSA